MGHKATLEIILDCSDPEKLATFWRQALGYRVHYSEPALAVLVPGDASAPPLILQQVPEPRGGKNRMHVDIVTEDVEAEVATLEALGARRIHDGLRSFGPVSWVTMADPEDNEFCVSTGTEW